jgi:arginine exporter protein ArgO
VNATLPSIRRRALLQTVRNVPVLAFLLAAGIVAGFQFAFPVSPILAVMNVVVLLGGAAYLVWVTYRNAVDDFEVDEEREPATDIRSVRRPAA